MDDSTMSSQSFAEEAPDLPLPQTVDQAEKLVQRFYLPGSPRDFERIDRCLKRLQKSDGAYGFADALMHSGDVHVRFFAALTFVVKINCDWDKLSEEQAEEMLQRLLAWLVRTVEERGGNLVVRKLCSALVAVFIKTAARWDTCLGHVIACLQAKGPVAKPNSHIDLTPIINGLEQHQFLAAIWFATILTEEVGNMSSEDVNTRPYFEALQRNIPDIVKLMTSGIGHQRRVSQQQCVIESIKFFHSLISTVGIESQPETKAALQHIMTDILQLLVSKEFFENVAELASDVLTNFNSFTMTKHFDTILQTFRSDEGIRRLLEVASGSEDADALAYARLYLAFGEAQLETLVTKPTAIEINRFMQQLFQITERPGFPAAEDEVAVEVLELWSKYVETAQEKLWDPKADASLQQCKGQVVNVVLSAIVTFLKKIQLPPAKVWSTWDSAAKIEFHGFRRDFQNFLSAAYAIFGPCLFENLGQSAVSAGVQKDWNGVEAALFAMSGIADAAAENDEMDKSLSILFSSGLWTEVTQLESTVPSVTRSTAVQLVALYQGFFRRNHQLLEPTIVFLFRCLDNPALTQTAAKTIYALCDTCREALALHAQSFVDQYALFLSTERREPDVKEKVVGGVAAVIQGQSMSPDPAARTTALQALDSLLKIIEAEISQGKESAATAVEDSKIAWERTIESIRCLASIGKSYRAPDTAAIDLEDDADSRLTDHEVSMIDVLRARIVELCRNMLQSYPLDGEMMEAVCNVLRAGIPEDSGPFMFLVQQVDDVLGQILLMTPKPGVALETAARLLRKRKNHSRRAAVQVFANSFFQRGMQMVANLGGDPSADTEKASSVIDFIQTYIPEYFHVFAAQDSQLEEPMQFFWLFTTTCLASHEILPRRSACSFWAAVFDARLDDRDEKDTLDRFIQMWGPRVAQALINGVGGEVPRSELDVIIGPLRKMIPSRREASRWLKEALFDSSFPSDRVSDQDKSVFLKSILQIRGGSKTKKVAKEFWVHCRGTFTS